MPVTQHPVVVGASIIPREAQPLEKALRRIEIVARQDRRHSLPHRLVSKPSAIIEHSVDGSIIIRNAYEMTSGDDRESSEARIVRAVLRLARRLRGPSLDGEVTGSGLALLASLHREGPMSAVALARSEGLQPQSLSRLLAQLEANMLIDRPIDPVDRRRQQITLTPTGAAALKRAMTRRRAWLADAMSCQLNDADRRTLLVAADVMLRLADHTGEVEHE